MSGLKYDHVPAAHLLERPTRANLLIKHPLEQKDCCRGKKYHIPNTMRPPKGRHCSAGGAKRRSTYSRRSNQRPGMVGASSITMSRAALMDARACGLERIRDNIRSLLTSPTDTCRNEDNVCPPTSWAAEPAHAKTTTAESPHRSRVMPTISVNRVLFPHPAAPTAATLRPPKTERATSSCDGSRRGCDSAIADGQTARRRRQRCQAQ